MATATAVKAPTSPAKKASPRPAAKKTTRPATKPAAKAPEPVASAEAGSPVLKLFRQGLDAMEKATTAVGETSLGTMSGFGIGEGATKKLVDTQAGAMHLVTSMTDKVATTAASVLDKGVKLMAKPFTSSDAKKKPAAKK